MLAPGTEHPGAGTEGSGGGLLTRKRIALAGIVHAEHDDGTDLAPELARVGALRLPLRHPAHLALIAIGEPGFEAFRRLRDRIGLGDAHHREALSESTLGDGALKLLSLQKSRLS